jgi:hypothetical protein
VGIAGCGGDDLDALGDGSWRQLGEAFDGLDEHALGIDRAGKLRLLYSVTDGGLVYASWDGAAWDKVEIGRQVGSFHQLYPMLLFDSQGRAVIGFGDKSLDLQLMRHHPAGGFESLAGGNNHKVVRGTPRWLQLDAADHMIAMIDEQGLNKAYQIYRFDQGGVRTELGRLAPADETKKPSSPNLVQTADGSTYLSFDVDERTLLFKHTAGTDWTQVTELGGASRAMAATSNSELVYAFDGQVVGGKSGGGTQVVKLRGDQPVSLGTPSTTGGGTFTQLQVSPEGRPVIYYQEVPEAFTTRHMLSIWKAGTDWQALPVLYEELTKDLGDGGTYVSFAVGAGNAIYASYSYQGKLQVFQLAP